MSHEIDLTTGRPAIAYVGETPWHGLGQRLQPESPIEEWRTAAGMDFSIISSPVQFSDHQGQVRTYPNRRVLMRDDTHAELSIVSNAYKVVQPGEVLEFYRSLVEAGGFKLHTAGVLNEGRKYWALAELGEQANIMGQDKIDGYLLLATACDGTLATRAMFTSIRVVCNNTLGFAVDEADSGRSSRRHISVPHSASFDPDRVKIELGLAPASWQSFIRNSNELARRDVDRSEVLSFLVQVFGDPQKPAEEQDLGKCRVMKRVLELFDGQGLGSEFKSSKGTAWGLVNAVTEYTDHHARCRTESGRLDRAWFGDGAALKQKAWTAAMEMVA